MNIQQILNERGTTHGDFAENASISQSLKAVVRSSANWREGRMSASQMESIDMILHKIGRIAAGDPYFADHWVDISGYATLAAREAE